MSKQYTKNILKVFKMCVSVRHLKVVRSVQSRICLARVFQRDGEAMDRALSPQVRSVVVEQVCEGPVCRGLLCEEVVRWF